MSDTNQKQQSGIKDLIAKGREQRYLTYAEVNDHLPEDIADPEQVEDIIQMINDMGITVFETAPDADTLSSLASDNTPDEVAAAEAAAALASVESEQHRTTDPVRMYMREMGSVELLTREGEIEIAKRIEEGTRELMSAVADWPTNVAAIIAEYEKVEAGEKKLTDIISGYLNPMEHVPSALAQQQAAEALKLENPEEARKRKRKSSTKVDWILKLPLNALTPIRKQLKKTDTCVTRYGRNGEASQKNLEELAELFKFLKLTPRQFDPLIAKVRISS